MFETRWEMYRSRRQKCQNNSLALCLGRFGPRLNSGSGPVVWLHKLCVTFALHAWSKHADAAGINCRLHSQPSGEVWHILAAVAYGERVRPGVEGDVGDGVGPVSVVLDVNLSLGAAVRDDLDGQLGGTGVGAVHDELPGLPDLGALQPWARATYLRRGESR